MMMQLPAGAQAENFTEPGGGLRTVQDRLQDAQPDRAAEGIEPARDLIPVECEHRGGGAMPFPLVVLTGRQVDLTP